jgi:hypothetical protein
MFLKIIKAIYDKRKANIILNGGQVKPFRLVRNKTGLSAFSTPIQYSFVIPKKKHVRQEQERKGIQTGEEEVKVYLFAGDKILYIKASKTLPKTIRNHKPFRQSSRIQN